MKIHFSCPDCGTKFTASSKLSGKRGKCEKCGSIIIIPAPESGDRSINDTMVEKNKLTEFLIKGNTQALTGGNRDDIYYYLRRALEEDSNNVDALASMGYFQLFVESKPDDAESYFESALAIDSKNTRSLAGIGLVIEHRIADMKRTNIELINSQFKQALEYYRAALKIDPHCIAVKAGIDRCEYALSPKVRILQDGTYIGTCRWLDYTGVLGRFKSVIYGLSSKSKLARVMNDFFRHIGYTPGWSWFPAYMSSMAFSFIIFISIFVALWIIPFIIQDLIYANSYVFFCVIVMIIRSLWVTIYRVHFLNMVTTHLIKETGVPVPDPDLENEEYLWRWETSQPIKTAVKMMVTERLFGFSSWTMEKRRRAISRKAFGGSRIGNLFLYIKLILVFPDKSLANIRYINLIMDVLNRHWYFHTRNPMNVDKVMNFYFYPNNYNYVDRMT